MDALPAGPGWNEMRARSRVPLSARLREDRRSVIVEARHARDSPSAEVAIIPSVDLSHSVLLEDDHR